MDPHASATVRFAEMGLMVNMMNRHNRICDKHRNYYLRLMEGIIKDIELS